MQATPSDQERLFEFVKRLRNLERGSIAELEELLGVRFQSTRNDATSQLLYTEGIVLAPIESATVVVFDAPERGACANLAVSAGSRLDREQILLELGAPVHTLRGPEQFSPLAPGPLADQYPCPLGNVMLAYQRAGIITGRRERPIDAGPWVMCPADIDAACYPLATPSSIHRASPGWPQPRPSPN